MATLVYIATAMLCIFHVLFRLGPHFVWKLIFYLNEFQTRDMKMLNLAWSWGGEGVWP